MTLHPYQAVRRWMLAVGVAAAALVAGCVTTPINNPARVGPFFEPRNVTRDPTLGGIRRVVLLPVWAGSVAPEETGADLDPVFRKALQDQNRFEVVTLSRAECLRRFGATALPSSAALPHDLMASLQKVFAADAVLFVDITVYRPYHPLAIGVRGRLATFNAQRMVWAFDNVFSADDPTVSAAARNYFLQSEHQGVPGDLTPAVLQSPTRFATYAAFTTFSTLPPVTMGVARESSGAGR